MEGVGTIYAKVHEDGSFTVLSRVTALDGTGSQVTPEEGYCLKQADISAIEGHIYSLGTVRDSTTGTEVLPAPTLTKAANIYDTLQVNGWPTGKDAYGYNFRHDVLPTYVPNPAEWYLLEYKITTTSGGVIQLDPVRVKTLPRRSS